MRKTALPRKFTVKLAVIIVALLIGGIFFFVNIPQQQSQAAERRVMSINRRPARTVCGKPGKNSVECHAHVVTTSSGNPVSTSTPYTGTYGPTQFHVGYNLPCTPGGAVQSICPQPTTFGPQTIAIVDAYNDKTIENDLQVYSNYYGLPSCTQANGCLIIRNQNGTTSLPRTTNSGWALETSLDVEVAHAMCQTCKILLIETNSNSWNNLATGVNTAARLGATAISNSYGGGEWSGENSYDAYYNHPGIAVTASAGDNGYGAEYPAASNGVVAVGGTTLTLYSDSTYADESAWSGTGSGCSLYENANSWQTALPNWGQTGCGNKRGIADVSADADPNTGAAVYDSTTYNGTKGWYQVGGTSLASPIIASVYALTGGVPAGINASQIPYANAATAYFHDVLGGTNGTCATSMCLSDIGYDGPTGLGTPNGILGFALQAINTPTPTPTVVPIATPTPTPTTAVPTATPTPTIAPTATPTVTPTPRPRRHGR